MNKVTVIHVIERVLGKLPTLFVVKRCVFLGSRIQNEYVQSRAQNIIHQYTVHLQTYSTQVYSTQLFTDIAHRFTDIQATIAQRHTARYNFKGLNKTGYIYMMLNLWQVGENGEVNTCSFTFDLIT